LDIPHILFIQNLYSRQRHIMRERPESDHLLLTMPHY